MPRKIKYEIKEEFDGLKLFTFLKYKNGYSTKLIRTLKNTQNGIVLNGSQAKTIDLLHSGDILEITIAESSPGIEPIDCPLDIIYEDEDILVINKSPYMAMHPTHNHQGDTLANGVAAHLSRFGKPCTFRAVGRLDKGTSGLVVCALNSLAACKLSGKVKKEYFALIQGRLFGSGTIDAPIYRPDPMKTLRACSYELGTEAAVTHWTAVKNYTTSTLIRLNLETGRTHQIRVHMAFIGHPVAGDSYYGSFKTQAGHQLLHCGRAELIHPVTGEKLVFTAPLPTEFEIYANE